MHPRRLSIITKNLDEDAVLIRNTMANAGSDISLSERRSRHSSLAKKHPPAHMQLVPELYIVPADKVQAERENPHSQDRVPNENIPLVWAQSLHILGNLISDDLLSPAELDPLGRRFHLYGAHRNNETVVQVVLLSETADLQSKLATFGLETQTVEQTAPVTISSPSALRDAYTILGYNEKLHLTGRPKRPIGTLSTCKLYKCQGQLYAFLPHFMDREEFYLVSDNDYLVSLFEQELAFVKHHWASPGRPTMVVMLTNAMLGGMMKADIGTKDHRKWRYGSASSRRNLLNFMMSLRSGLCGGVRVRLGRVTELINTSCIESLDFLVKGSDEDAHVWHNLLRGGNLLQESSNRRLHFSEVITAASVSSTAAPHERRKTKRRNDSGDQGTGGSGSKSPLTSPFFTEEPSEFPIGDDWKLQDHQEELAKLDLGPSSLETPSRGNSPIRGMPSNRIGVKSAFTDDGTTPPAHEHFRKGRQYSFDVNCTPVEGINNPEDKDILTLTLNDSTHVPQATKLLASSANLYDQIDLLHYLFSCCGGKYYVDNLGTVEGLLEEVYVKVCFFCTSFFYLDYYYLPPKGIIVFE